MNKNNWHSDFEMLYEDWMVTSSEKINSIIFAEELVTYIEQKYPQNNCKNTESYNHFYDKALAMQQKLAMMQYAIHNYYLAKADFESTQNMTIPSLYGMGKTKILFYVESAIIFARITLDVSANIYSDILFNCREDSFNKLCKKIDIQDNSIFNDFKKKKAAWQKNAPNAFNLLCGTAKGRALRDVIIHQTNVTIEYDEYKENSEREKLFIILKDFGQIDLDLFISQFSLQLYNILSEFNILCKMVINNKKQLDSERPL